jgi:hypothetical protein
MEEESHEKEAGSSPGNPAESIDFDAWQSGSWSDIWG